MAALAITACGSDENGSSGDATKVAYSNPVGAQPGQQDIVFGFKAGAEELGWTAESIDANLSPDKQVADIATMVAQGQDGIASWTLDPGAAAGAYSQAQAAAHPGRRRELRGHGHRRDGVVGDQPVRRRFAHRGAHAVHRRRRSRARRCSRSAARPSRRSRRTSGASPRTRRRTGSTIVATAHNTKDTAATAQPIVADLLTKNRDVDAIWAYNDASALGASAALIADGGKVYDGSGDGVIVFGQNGDVDAITAIREHRLTGTLDPDPVATGWALIKALSGFVGKDKVDDPPTELVVKSETWTLDNIDDYTPPRERRYTLDTVPLVDAPRAEPGHRLAPERCGCPSP